MKESFRELIIRLKPVINFVLGRFFVIPAKFRASRE
jgi:hypothetical protein